MFIMLFPYTLNTKNDKICKNGYAHATEDKIPFETCPFLLVAPSLSTEGPETNFLLEIKGFAHLQHLQANFTK